MLTAIASLGVPLGTFIYRGVARWPIGLLLCIEFALIGLGFVWMGKATTPSTFVSAAAVNQIGAGMILPTLLVWATRGLHFQIRGRGTGIWQGTFAVGQFVCGLVVTWLAVRLGGPLAAFVVLGMSAAVAALAALLRLSEVRHSQRSRRAWWRSRRVSRHWKEEAGDFSPARAPRQPVTFRNSRSARTPYVCGGRSALNTRPEG